MKRDWKITNFIIKNEERENLKRDSEPNKKNSNKNEKKKSLNLTEIKKRRKKLPCQAHLIFIGEWGRNIFKRLWVKYL